MARLEDLISTVENAVLRDALASEVRSLKQHVSFGLVFERHLPENILLPASAGVSAGDNVRLRSASADSGDLRVLSRAGSTVRYLDADGKEGEASVEELVVVKGMGDAIYPTLRPLGSVRRGGDKPFHAVIDGENYHALQAMTHCWAGQVDCIYADPPYNTGARDWKYNNDYVDSGDSWRHSKWLSMMEKRLRLAKRLLKPDGVLIVTIDENELHHLGVLLEMLFPDAHRQMVTICINPAGAGGADGLSRVEEYAIFCFLGGTQPTPTPDDMLVAGADEDVANTGAQGVRWEWLMRGGNAWYRDSRPNLCYPVLLTKDGTRIAGIGEPYSGPEGKRPKRIDGHPVAWPVRRDGQLGIWRVDAAKLTALAEQGYAYVSNRDERRGTWTIKYLMSGTVEAIEAGNIEVTGRGERGEVQVRVSMRRGKTAKTMWYRSRHTAGGAGGTHILNQFLGERNLFPFPKSVYAVKDCLQVAVGSRRDAFIVDFFGGSGTTQHATMLLNAEDDGSRRCALVTNNEVGEKRGKELTNAGLAPGEADYDKYGIFEAVTRPRLTAAITGVRPDGETVVGQYLDGKPFASGLEENCEFFRLEYSDPDHIELGRAFQAIHPLLWLAAGAHGERDDSLTPKKPYVVVPDGGYGVLFSELALREFVAALNDAAGMWHVFLVTNSEDAYAEMCESISAGITTHMLYRDYLRSFRIQVATNA